MTASKRRPKPRRDAGRPRGEPIAAAVLARTLEELAAHGISELSVDRIARAAEVNKTSVYRRWPTRAELVAAALDRARADLTSALPDTGSLRGDLRAMVELVAGFMGSPTGRALASAALGTAGAPEIASLAAQRLESQAGGPARELAQRAIARGEWRAEVEPAVVLSTLLGAITQRVLLEQREASPAWMDALVDLVLRGVTPRAGRRGGAPATE